MIEPGAPRGQLGERELGEALFHRNQRGVTLTAAGHAFLPHARAALASVERGRDTVQAMQGLLTGQLRVGVSGPLDWRFATALGAYARAHPGIELSLREDNRERIVSAVGQGELGVAQICMTGEPVPTSVSTEVVSVDPLVVAVGCDHPLAACDEVPLTWLEGEPIITLEAGTGLRSGLEAVCAASGFAPRIERLVGLAWNEAATSPAVRAFLELAADHFAASDGSSGAPDLGTGTGTGAGVRADVVHLVDVPVAAA